MFDLLEDVLKFQNIVSDGVLSLGLALAYELKLFDALAEISSAEKPATAAELSAKTDLKERFFFL